MFELLQSPTFLFELQLLFEYVLLLFGLGLLLLLLFCFDSGFPVTAAARIQSGTSRTVGDVLGFHCALTGLSWSEQDHTRPFQKTLCSC